MATSIAPAELLQLVEHELSGPSPKFLAGELGILDLDSGRYVAACGGVVPLRVLDRVKSEGGLSGTALVTHFGGPMPPEGYTFFWNRGRWARGVTPVPSSPIASP